MKIRLTLCFSLITLTVAFAQNIGVLTHSTEAKQKRFEPISDAQRAESADRKSTRLNSSHVD